MTAQKLYELFQFLDNLDRELELQSRLDGVKQALANLVSSPAHPQYQTALAQTLKAFQEAAAELGEAITPSQKTMLREMGGEEYFDPAIVDKVKNSVEKNAMTPQVALQFVQDLAQGRDGFLTTVRGARDNLKKLKITESPVKPGSADLSFIIPRNIFDNQLAPFAKELTYISRMLQHFSEGLTGETADVELEQLSSSIPTIALAAKAKIINALAEIVNKFLDAWEKIERIRKMRGEMAEMGFKGAPIDALTEQITTTVDEVVEESTQIILVNYDKSPARKNELDTAVRQDVRRLFGQIERGLTVEFRAEPKKDADPEQQKALQNISEIARVIQFPKVAQEPMLLESGKILEGDIHTFTHTKKTTMRKTTTTSSKKGEPKEANPAASE